MNTRSGRQSMSELKLRRLIEHNQRLREDLARPRMRVSEASARYIAPLRPLFSGSWPFCSLIRYCKTTKDHLVRIMAFWAPNLALRSAFHTGSFSLGASGSSRRSVWTATNRKMLHYSIKSQALHFPSLPCTPHPHPHPTWVCSYHRSRLLQNRPSLAFICNIIIPMLLPALWS